MDESTDAIVKDSSHQLLKCRGCALQSPICITWLLNVPSTVANTVLWMYSSTMHICSYALDISSFEQYTTLAISLWMISWSGNRVTSLTMLLFCSCRSKTVCSLPFFFGMQSIGTTWCATAGIHHCVVVYLSIFWQFFTEMLWAFQQLVVDALLRIN